MVTPTREEIREEALNLFFQDNPPRAITPEDEELKESGYWDLARDSLMRSPGTESLEYIEQMAHEIGYRLVTEKDHDKLLDLERRVTQIKDKEQQIKVLQSGLENIKRDLDSQGNVKTVTVEKILKEVRWRTRKRRKKRIIEKAIKAFKAGKIEDNPAGIRALNTVLMLNDLDVLKPLDI